jgi:hypothetical protein
LPFSKNSALVHNQLWTSKYPWFDHLTPSAFLLTFISLISIFRLQQNCLQKYVWSHTCTITCCVFLALVNLSVSIKFLHSPTSISNMLYAFFWVIPRRLNFISRRFGTLYLLHLHVSKMLINCWVHVTSYRLTEWLLNSIKKNKSICSYE